MDPFLSTDIFLARADFRDFNIVKTVKPTPKTEPYFFYITIGITGELHKSFICICRSSPDAVLYSLNTLDFKVYIFLKINLL